LKFDGRSTRGPDPALKLMKIDSLEALAFLEVSVNDAGRPLVNASLGVALREQAG
jgi:hypothetical protein